MNVKKNEIFVNFYIYIHICICSLKEMLYLCKKLKKQIIMLKHLTTQEFKEKVFNYEQNQEWKFEGDKPCLIDFYADWCSPCKMVAPILEELAKEYEGKLDIYKIDTEAEQELAAVFGIRSIPSLLFVPKEGQPQMAMGALPKETFIKAIDEVLGVKPPIIVK
jgi:thioredoxin